MYARKLATLGMLAGSFWFSRHPVSADGCGINGCSCTWDGAEIGLQDCPPDPENFGDVCETACQECHGTALMHAPQCNSNTLICECFSC